MSSNTNLDAVRAIYASFGAGDIPGILSHLSPGIDWTFFGPRELPFAGHYSGHDQIVGFFTTVGRTVLPERFEPREMIDAGETVVVLGYEEVLVRETGRRFTNNWLHAFTFEEGKVSRVREYYDTATMVRAFEPAPAAGAKSAAV